MLAAKKLVAAIVVVGMTAFQLSPTRAEVNGASATRLLRSAVDLLCSPHRSHESNATKAKRQQIETASDREARVAHISLCPRRVLMYVGEEHVLAPLPLDNSRAPVHGVAFSYESGDATIAEMASDGTVTAVKPGACFVTATVGQKKAKVKVEVRDGPRPRLTNAQWDAEHANDCRDPEQDPSPASSSVEVQSNGGIPPKPPFSPELLPAPDNDPPPNIASAGSHKNAVGHPRFTSDLRLQSEIASEDNQLGSSSFNFTVPIFSSGGRGVGVDLNLVYNSRLWTKDSSTMVFDYDVGWPAPGFRLNYGRIVPNYNGSSGNYLLVEADGTRTPLINISNNYYRSNDGRYLEFTTVEPKRLFMPNGTVVSYEAFGSQLLPTQIKDVHGNSITIDYVTSCQDASRIGTCDCNTTCVKPPKQAIKQITDTLGRHVTFYYNTTGQLAEIRVPGFGGPTASDRTVAKFSYQTITLNYTFSTGITVIAAPSQVDVLRRVYFPDTGRGYVFDSYSGYGMFTHASMRLGMTDASDGTEVAYTEYTLLTSGQLDDSPQISQRSEWWLHKTNDSGTDVTTAATYNYSREIDANAQLMTNTVTAPNGVASVMISENDSTNVLYGLLKEQKIQQGTAVKLDQEFFYDLPSTAQGLQLNTVITTDDASNQSQVLYSYGTYGRLMETTEYGFQISGAFKKRRRTVYAFLDDANYFALSMYKLVTDITIYDAKETNSNTDDTLIAHTHFVYDTPDTGWDITTYGFTKNCDPNTSPSCTPPPGFSTKFVDRATRGLVTKVQLWSDATAASADISFRHAYDIFGNELKAEVSCCSLKTLEFRDTPITDPPTSAMYWSVPFSTTDGAAGGPNLKSGFAYDFNTNFLTSQTDPNGLVTSYAPDAAMRLRTVTYPKLSTDTNANPTLQTFYVDSQNAESSTDTLAYQSKFTYYDFNAQGTAVQRVQISNQWLDGAGRVIRRGSSAGPTITSFDVVKSIYDDLGRLRKTTNPYNTTNADGNTTGLPNPTTYDYDWANRVVTVTLPDSNTMTTIYNGAVATVTDQAGRQRQSETDGLGRTVRVTEMNGSNQLAWDTTYGYDLNDNLTSVNQGGQTRAFKYDSLSRMTFERTPEQDATISVTENNVTTYWSAMYTYTEFNAISTRKDARGVITTNSYDGLNRLYQVAYTLPNPNTDNVQATATVNISYGTTAPKNGQVEEVKQSFSTTDVPWKESYAYDGLSRLSSKTLSFDSGAYSYTTSYGYNQAGQVTQMTYPSTKVVKYGFDDRGRLNAIGDSTLATKYVSSASYNPSQQIGSIGLGNGLTENHTYSADRLQLTNQNVKQGSTTTLMSLTYNYVADKSRSGGVGTGTANTGQLMDITGSQINDQTRNETYNYDQVARLTQASGFYAQRSYVYDRWGNRTSVSGGASQMISYAKDANNVPLTNRIQSVNSGANYQYDAAGNTINDTAHAYSFDAESRIVRVDSGSTATYFYDSANRRVKKISGGYTTYYVWEGSNVIAEYGNAPAGSGGTRFYHPDRLSNRLITDGTGLVKGTMDNLPFGEDAVTGTGESEKHRFTSYERDTETGSDYAVNRQHEYSTGRFMRPDPSDGSYDVVNPQTLNRYTYVGNDPVNGVDPLGLLVCFLDYSYEHFTYTDENGEDVIGIRVVAHQQCFDIGWGSGGGALRQLIGGDIGTGGSVGGGIQAIKNVFNKFRRIICATIPSGRTYGVSAGFGALTSVIGGGEIVFNYDSGQVSAFGFGGTQIGFSGGLSGSVYTGNVWGLNSSNSNYSGGFTGGNLSPKSLGGGGVFAAASSGGLTGSARSKFSLGSPVVGESSLGASVIPSLGGLTFTNYSQPRQLGKYWPLALNPSDALLFAARRLCK
jgi:RHS repeat-associated protein